MTAALALAVLAACAPPDSLGPVGLSTPTNRSGGAESADASVATTTPAIPIDFRKTFKKLSRTRYKSVNHFTAWMDVYANDSAASAYAQPSGDISAGALFIAEEFVHTVAGEARGPVLVMEKRAKGFDPAASDWRYMVIDPSGKVTADGKAERCDQCHADAPRDHIFLIVE